MKIFTIESESNNIILHGSLADAEAVTGAERFSSSEELADLAANWPTSRLIDIWNGLPGVTSVTKFKDRKTAITRIWNTIRSLHADEVEGTFETTLEVTPANEPLAPELRANVSEQARDAVPVAEEPTKKATRKAKTPRGEKVVKAPREASKTGRVIGMLKREGGATLEEIMTEMGWLKHTTRAMLSAGGSLTKNHGLVVTSEMVGDKRTYSIKG